MNENNKKDIEEVLKDVKIVEVKPNRQQRRAKAKQDLKDRKKELQFAIKLREKQLEKSVKKLKKAAKDGYIEKDAAEKILKTIFTDLKEVYHEEN
jgi:argininosuccinate lyase